ncbi:MAG: hypothetical protein J7639_22510 [Paenibacillaceae bacterium]|nr:hypothetical protein [Paenibacillaceae bacterium]
MKKFVFLLLLLLSASACGAGNVPADDDFAVAVTVADKVLKANDDLIYATELTNLSKHKAAILHAAPLVHVQIYDEHDKPLIDSFVTATVGIMQTLQPKETYRPGTDNGGGAKSIRLEKAGTYKLVGTASFSVDTGNGERKEYKLLSPPVEVTVADSGA